MQHSAKVLVCGHLSLDLRPDIGVEALELPPGQLIRIGPLHATCGGAVFNTGVTLHKLGVPTALIGKVGDDDYGRIVSGVLDKYGAVLKEGLIVERRDHTSYSIIMDPRVTDRTILHYPGANDTLDAGEILPLLTEEMQVVHFGYPQLMKRMYQDGGVGLASMYRLVKQKGGITSLDTALVEPDCEAGQVDWAAYLKHVLPAVDVYLPSFEELYLMLRRPSYLAYRSQTKPVFDLLSLELLSDLADELIAYGAAVVCIKLGKHGLYMKTASDRKRWRNAALLDARDWAGKELYVPCFEVEVNGTTGAGDAAIAGFLACLLHKEGPENALRMAAAVGAYSVSGADAVSEIPPLHEVKSDMSRLIPRRSAMLPARRWQFDTDGAVWRGPYTRTGQVK